MLVVISRCIRLNLCCLLLHLALCYGLLVLLLQERAWSVCSYKDSVQNSKQQQDPQEG